MVDNVLNNIWRQFTGQNAVTPDSQRLGSNLNSGVLVAPTIPVGGFKDAGLSKVDIPAPTVVEDGTGARAYTRQTSPATEQQIADSEAIQALKSSVSLPDMSSINVTPAIETAMNAMSAQLPKPETLQSPTILNVAQSAVQSVGNAILAQNSVIQKALVSKSTKTKDGKKTVTQIFSTNPSVPIEQQTLKTQTQQTVDRVKTITKVYGL